MSLGDPIPVRFSEAADQRLSEVARRSGLSKAELIRLATDEFLARVAKSGVIEQRIVLTGVDGMDGVDGLHGRDGLDGKDGAARTPVPLSRAKKK